MNSRIPSSTITRSGPDQALLTPHIGQADRIRMGRVQPMATLPVRPWEARATYAVVALSVAVLVVAGVWL